MRVFKETQRFDHWWLHLVNIAVIGFIAFACYHWFILDKWTPTLKGFMQVIALLFMPLGMVLVYLLRLETQIDEKGVHYRFLPFHRSFRTIHWSAIRSIEVRKYRPILEYGGWGYRIPFQNGKAYNIKGNKGIQLQLTNSRKVLIGTQKETEAQKVIHRYM